MLDAGSSPDEKHPSEITVSLVTIGGQPVPSPLAPHMARAHHTLPWQDTDVQGNNRNTGQMYSLIEVRICLFKLLFVIILIFHFLQNDDAMSLSAMSISQKDSEDLESGGPGLHEGLICSMPESPNLDVPAGVPDLSQSTHRSPQMPSTQHNTLHASGGAAHAASPSASVRTQTPREPESASSPFRTANSGVPVPITKLDIESRLLGRSLRGLLDLPAFSSTGQGSNDMEAGGSSGIQTSGTDKSDESDLASESCPGTDNMDVED